MTIIKQCCRPQANIEVGTLQPTEIYDPKWHRISTTDYKWTPCGVKLVIARLHYADTDTSRIPYLRMQCRSRWEHTWQQQLDEHVQCRCQQSLDSIRELDFQVSIQGSFPSAAPSPSQLIEKSEKLSATTMLREGLKQDGLQQSPEVGPKEQLASLHFQLWELPSNQKPDYWNTAPRRAAMSPTPHD